MNERRRRPRRHSIYIAERKTQRDVTTKPRTHLLVLPFLHLSIPILQPGCSFHSLLEKVNPRRVSTHRIELSYAMVFLLLRSVCRTRSALPFGAAVRRGGLLVADSRGLISEEAALRWVLLKRQGGGAASQDG